MAALRKVRKAVTSVQDLILVLNIWVLDEPKWPLRIHVSHILLFSHCLCGSGVPEGQLVGELDCRHDQQCGGGTGHDAFWCGQHETVQPARGSLGQGECFYLFMGDSFQYIFSWSVLNLNFRGSFIKDSSTASRRHWRRRAWWDCTKAWEPRISGSALTPSCPCSSGTSFARCTSRSDSTWYHHGQKCVTLCRWKVPYKEYYYEGEGRQHEEGDPDKALMSSVCKMCFRIFIYDMKWH